MFLSASLFSMERGEVPAEEKKAPVLSTEQRTAMSRRAEKSIEDEETDPSQGLERSMRGCQLGDTTIINSSQQDDQQPSSLQEDENSDAGSGMEGIQPRFNEFADNDPTGKPRATPEKSKASTASQFAEVTPSPGKRANSNYSFFHAQGGFNEGDFNLVSPSPKRGNAAQKPPSLIISQQEFLQRAQEHQAILSNHAEETRKAASSINAIFPPRERKKTDPLLVASHNVGVAMEVLKAITEHAAPSAAVVGVTGETAPENQALMIKFKLGVMALHQAIEDVNTSAEALVEDERGSSVNQQLTLLKKYQEDTESATALQNAFQVVPSSVLNTISFSNASAKTEFRQQKIEEAHALLQEGKILTVTNREEQSPVDLALSIFEECQDQENLDKLNSAAVEVEKNMLLIEASQKNLELSPEGEGHDFALFALKTANEEALKSISQLKVVLNEVSRYQKSWGLDVQAILSKLDLSTS
ncbi:MAG: hypothetical protein WCO92_03360 [Verrucomicrobiota bacterium]